MNGKVEQVFNSLQNQKTMVLRSAAYMRDPDAYIIEVGQTTGGLKDTQDWIKVEGLIIYRYFL